MILIGMSFTDIYSLSYQDIYILYFILFLFCITSLMHNFIVTGAKKKKNKKKGNNFLVWYILTVVKPKRHNYNKLYLFLKPFGPPLLNNEACISKVGTRSDW